MATPMRSDKTDNSTSLGDMLPYSKSITIFGHKREPEADFQRVML